jgi:hypothetical protein
MNPIVIGLSIAVLDKSIHGVALSADRVVGTLGSLEVKDIVNWCRCSKANVVAVAGASQWAPAPGRLRTADRQLLDAGLTQLSTPAADDFDPNRDVRAVEMELYAALAPSFPLYTGRRRARCCIETRTTPAVVALAEPRPDLKSAYPERDAVMSQFGFDLRSFGCASEAAISALVAHAFVAGASQRFGDRETGYVFVPNPQKIPRRNKVAFALAKEPCERCYGVRWVCEDHPWRPQFQCRECEGSVGAPCVCNPTCEMPRGYISFFNPYRDDSRN